MTTIIRIFVMSVMLLLLGCDTGWKKPLVKKDENDIFESTNNLIVFVGEKIEVKEFTIDGQILMDGAYHAKYKVVQMVYGNYDKRTIEFDAYDHYGEPAFSRYKNVLLFVVENKGKYYHEKYQYNDVYKTKDGRWAGCYALQDYGHPFIDDSTTIKPQKIQFAEEVSYPAKIKYANGEEYSSYYPEPYFKMVEDKAIAVYGNYLEELFRLKKEGVLAARGLFRDKNLDKHAIEQEVIMDEVIQAKPYNTRNIKFETFWNTLSDVVKTSNMQKFKTIALDSLDFCESVIPVDSFINNLYEKVVDKEMVSNFGKNSSNIFQEIPVDTLGMSFFKKQKIIKSPKGFRLIWIKTMKQKQGSWSLGFSCIETKDGFRIYSCFSGDGRECSE